MSKFPDRGEASLHAQKGFEITSPSSMNRFNSAMLYYQLTLELVLGSFLLALVFA